ncbi:hypothetical protein HGM15179_020806 [Zosterops borbonicus]|uniref:Uncharacterized protein n=1 Tax=Zosterops borbonicus TaxID=364589 RepID=A0A8K1D796_9PASS|nr:hypothetical protein HGM15179_020806 [Zosterops borbonicus]
MLTLIRAQKSALNVKVKKFSEARVNGGSNYDSLNTQIFQWKTKMSEPSLSFSGGSLSLQLPCSTHLTQQTDSLYMRPLAILSRIPQEMLTKAALLAVSNEATGLESAPTSELITTVEKVKEGKKSVRIKESNEEDIEQRLMHKFGETLDQLITMNKELTIFVKDKVAEVDKKLGKLQTDIAFLSSRASEGRPILEPVYLFGEGRVPTKPLPSLAGPSHQSLISWKDLGL